MPNLTRGAAQCRFDLGETYGTITPSYDAASNATQFADCVLDAGDKFALNYTQSSLLVSFSSGCLAKVGGSFWALKESASITLPQNQTIYICLTIDKSQQDGSKADITFKSLAQIQRGVIYAGGTVRDVPIYKVTTNATGVSGIEDLRKIVRYDILSSEIEYELEHISGDNNAYSIYEEE